ncbi:hypothetical protein PG996_001124 [Apiospora saccharicola]|uniref:BHLH domain-containing protein n=1 Tax=Apiospora saccharicola TaxID=335842 RepID=A0ABR1WFX5_9PEZI
MKGKPKRPRATQPRRSPDKRPPPDSSCSPKQMRWEKRCRKNLHLLDEHLEHLVGANAGNHTIPSKSLRVDARSLQAHLSVARSYLQDLERIQDTLAAESGGSTASDSEPTVDVSDPEQDSGNGSSHPSKSAQEAVQEKWLSLARRSSTIAPTASPVPIPSPITPEPGLGRGRAYIRAPGPAAPLSFTSYAPGPSTPKDAEANDDTVKKEDDTASLGRKQGRRRRYAKWFGKSTTPIPPPSSIQRMQKGANGVFSETSTPSTPTWSTRPEKQT